MVNIGSSAKMKFIQEYPNKNLFNRSNAKSDKKSDLIRKAEWIIKLLNLFENRSMFSDCC